MQAKMELTVDFAGFKKIRASMRRNTPTRDRILTKWAFRYRVFAERRFIKFAGGGGDWAPLKRKRRLGARSAAAVLRNTGLLLGALSVSVKSAPGAVESKSGFRVTVGYGGATAHSGGSATIADIARFHNYGAGVLPVRKIITLPPPDVLTLMQQDAIKLLGQ